MPSVFARTTLFLSGYTPLLLIFSIQFFPKYGWWVLVPFGLGVGASFGLLAFLIWVRRGAPAPIQVKDVERKDSEVISYLFAYVFPFLSLSPTDKTNVLGLGVFFLVLMILNISSNMVHINPSLSLIGFHVYAISTKDGNSHTLITKRSRLVPGTAVQVVPIGDGISMEK